MIIPLLTILLPILIFTDIRMTAGNEYKKALYAWGLLSLGCFGLAFFTIHQTAQMMGGGFSCQETLWHGCFLFILFGTFRFVNNQLTRILTTPLQMIKHPLLRKAVNTTMILVFLFMVAVPLFLAETNIHRPKITNLQNPKSLLNLNFETVTLTTSDHVKIAGWFIPARSEHIVLIAHGLGANKSNFLGIAGLWHELGFNVLIFDFRGHGDSDGHTISLGYLERKDILAALNYLRDVKKFSHNQIVGHGISFGGAAMLQAAAEDSRFNKIIIDSSFADLDHMAMQVLSTISLVPSILKNPIKNIALKIIAIDLGFDLRQHPPALAVQYLPPTPLLFLHGKGDPLIPWTESQLLFENAKPPKQLIYFNTTGHFGTPNDPEYIKTIRNFLDQ